jgi:uncharacterized protein YqeY
MKAKDKVRLETVRSIKKVILEKESTLRAQGQETLHESQELEVLRSWRNNAGILWNSIVKLDVKT